MMKDMVNCDICYPKQPQESASPVRKKKELSKFPERNTTCNFSAQYDAGRDIRRRHRRQYEVKHVICQKCHHPTASSSDDMNNCKARFWRRAKKPETEDKSIGFSWSKRSFANVRNLLHRPCKWCRDYKDTSSQCATKKDNAKIPNKPFQSIQTRTLTVMTDKKMTRDKSALMNLPTIKEDCGVQTRSKGLTKPIKLKSYANHDSAVGPSNVGDNIVQRERTKKSIRNRKMPTYDAAIEQTNIGDAAAVDLYNKDIHSSDDSDEKKKSRKRDAKIANKRCGIWNIQFLTHAKHYPSIRLEISPRQTINKLGEALPKISRETAKENIISWFDYKTHSKSTLRSKKHATTEKRTTTTQFRGVRNYIVNRCNISKSDASNNINDDNDNNTDDSENNTDGNDISDVSKSVSTINESIHAEADVANDIKTKDKNLYRNGNFQSKVDVYQLFTNFKESTSTVNLFDIPSISSVNAEEIDLDNQTLYDSLVLQTTDNEEFEPNLDSKAYDDNTSISEIESNTYIVVSDSDSFSKDNILQRDELKMAVLNLYTESELSNNTYDIEGSPKILSDKRGVKRIRKKHGSF